MPPRDFHGVAVTYARVATVGARWARQCRPTTLVVADEAHHLGEELAWGEGFAPAFRARARWLLLSGTPFRSDTTPIPGVRYDAEGVAVADISYTYADAVRDGVCRPVTFIPYDGTLQWRTRRRRHRGVVRRRAHRPRGGAPLPHGDLRRSCPTACRGSSPRRTTSSRSLRAGGHRDAGGLVVAADSDARARDREDAAAT